MEPKNYQYLLRIYSLVDEYLASSPDKEEVLPEMIVSFCIIVEKLLKIKLHENNPVLVYENAKIKENDALISIIKNKENNIETINIRDTLSRYKLMFPDDFSEDEMQVLIDIYNSRNHFVHSHKADDDMLLEKDNLIKKMGTVWEKISKQAISIFSKDLIKANKPEKKYSEEELEKVLTEEVRKKIQSVDGLGFPQISNSLSILESLEYTRNSSFLSDPSYIYRNPFSYNKESCPRCGSFEFYLDEPELFPSSAITVSSYCHGRTFSDLYKCKKCNLELTRKEYEIAKKIKRIF